MKKLLVLSFALIAILTIPAGVFAEVPEMTEAFVCPVLNETVGEYNPNAVGIGGGDYSIIGPDISVPTTATNADGDGTPGGAHSAPGDTDYTAIWAK